MSEPGYGFGDGRTVAGVSEGAADHESIKVLHAALPASVAYLTAAEPAQLAPSLSLMYPALDTIHTLSQSLPRPPRLGPTTNTTHVAKSQPTSTTWTCAWCGER